MRMPKLNEESHEDVYATQGSTQVCHSCDKRSLDYMVLLDHYRQKCSNFRVTPFTVKMTIYDMRTFI